MPSGITHMMISKRALDNLADDHEGKISDLLQQQSGLYIAGCVAPDLPYMTMMDLNVFSKRTEIADSMHYDKTNAVPLMGLEIAKNEFEAGRKETADALFAFYIGYCSHVIADGVVHPYVRDQVGDYSVAAKQHRALEMKLDVFIARELLGAETNKISFHDEISWIKDATHLELVCNSFASALKTIYNHDVTGVEVRKWLDVMQMIFDLATGDFPLWYQGVMKDLGATFSDLTTIENERAKILFLEMPIDAGPKGLPTNYMGVEKVDFFKDVLPKYFELYHHLQIKAYQYVFENGPSPDSLLPAMNLDTGRLLASESLTSKPALYRVIA